MNKILILCMKTGLLFAKEAADTNLLRDKVIELEKKLAAIETKSRKEQDRHNAYKQRVNKVLKTRKGEVAILRSDLETQDKKWQQTKARIQFLDRKSREINARFKAVNDIICEFAKKIKGSIRAGFPAEQEKRESTLDIITAHEAFSRLWVIMDNEERFGADIEVRTRDITLPRGVVTAVEELRIGRQALMYISADNKYYGLLNRQTGEEKTGYVWLTKDLDYATRSAIRNAIFVKTGKKPPKLVNIPIFISNVNVKGGKQ